MHEKPGFQQPLVPSSVAARSNTTWNIRDVGAVAGTSALEDEDVTRRGICQALFALLQLFPIHGLRLAFLFSARALLCSDP